MSSPKKNRYGEKEDEPDDRSLFDKLVEDVIAFVVCCFLVRWGVMCLISVKIPLMIIAVIVGVVIISWRVYRRRDHDDY